MKRFKTVDAYLDAAEHWQDELMQLRKILNSTALEETVKWGGPCYTADGKNVVGLGAFQSHVGLWFFQGALLSEATRASRLKKVLPMIAAGKGLNDRYRNC